jgi:hypothetical protein
MGSVKKSRTFVRAESSVLETFPNGRTGSKNAGPSLGCTKVFSSLRGCFWEPEPSTLGPLISVARGFQFRVGSGSNSFSFPECLPVFEQSCGFCGCWLFPDSLKPAKVPFWAGNSKILSFLNRTCCRV